jgi:hypothetical protein
VKVFFSEYVHQLRNLPHRFRRLKNAQEDWEEMKVGIPDKLEVYQSCMLGGSIVESIWNEQDGRRT